MTVRGSTQTSALSFRSFHRARCQRSRSAPGKRQQRDVARALDSHTEPTLVTRTHPRHAARQNLAALLHELRKNVRALVVDKVHLFDAKFADFLLAKILALAAARSSGSTWAASTWAALSATTAATRSTFTTASSRMSASAAFAARRALAALSALRAFPACLRRCSRGGLSLFLFVCHTFLPFRCRSGQWSQSAPTQTFSAIRPAITLASFVPFPEPPTEPVEAYAADGAQHVVRACAPISSGVSDPHPGARSDT
jgi:hypothetical protein